METEPKTWQASVMEALKEARTDFLYLGDAHVYVTPSGSDPEDFYYELVFDINGERVKVCAKCKGFRYRGTCQHTERVP